MTRPGKPSLGEWLVIGSTTIVLGPLISAIAGDGTLVGFVGSFAAALVLAVGLWGLVALRAPHRVILDENPPGSPTRNGSTITGGHHGTAISRHVDRQRDKGRGD